MLRAFEDVIGAELINLAVAEKTSSTAAIVGNPFSRHYQRAILELKYGNQPLPLERLIEEVELQPAVVPKYRLAV